MEYSDASVALENYTLIKGAFDREPALPSSDAWGVLHAVLRNPWRGEVEFCEDVLVFALCKRDIRVILPDRFDDADTSVCRECSAVLAERQVDVLAWEENQQLRKEYGRRKGHERDVLRRLDVLGEDYGYYVSSAHGAFTIWQVVSGDTERTVYESRYLGDVEREMLRLTGRSPE
jgi:hypothetical protein